MVNPNRTKDHTPILISADALRNWVTRVFVLCGLNQPNASTAANLLVEADLFGIDSHGVLWLQTYVERLLDGIINPQPQFQITTKTHSAILLDGDQGLGMVVGAQAMELAIDLARTTGIAAVWAKRSNHFGAAGGYVRMAARQHMIGIACSNAGPAMAPTGSLTPYLGTNPLAFGVPGGIEGGIVLDMATSQVASGKITLALQEGGKIPFGWATDQRGFPTDDPETALSGLMLPLGGYKGYGLGLIVEILCALLVGGSFGPHLYDPTFVGSQVARGISHLCIAINIEALGSMPLFLDRMGMLVEELHNCQPAGEMLRVQVPGEKQVEIFAQRSCEGIPLKPYLVADLDMVGERVGCPPPWSQ